MVTDYTVSQALARFISSLTAHALTQCALAMISVLTTAYMVVNGTPIPEVWLMIVSGLVGSYFTSYPTSGHPPAGTPKQE